MRGLKKNEQIFYYCLYQGTEPLYDKYGNETGIKTLYSEPVKMSANISAAQGTTQVKQFGTAIQYSKVIVTCDMNCSIDEYSILFVGIKPVFDADGNPLKNYIVKKVAKSLNVIAIAILEVQVS